MTQIIVQVYFNKISPLEVNLQLKGKKILVLSESQLLQEKWRALKSMKVLRCLPARKILIKKAFHIIKA